MSLVAEITGTEISIVVAAAGLLGFIVRNAIVLGEYRQRLNAVESAAGNATKLNEGINTQLNRLNDASIRLEERVKYMIEKHEAWEGRQTR